MENSTLKGREKILQAAIKEFAEQGYVMGSVNTICEKGNISKGAMYHHFKDKEELYLACLDRCFSALTDFVNEFLAEPPADPLQMYFSARLEFFIENPNYQKLFSEATLMPSNELQPKIREIRRDFDDLNQMILRKYLSNTSLRPGISVEQGVELFVFLQNSLSTWNTETNKSKLEISQHEALRSRILDVLLYGIIERNNNINE